MNQLSFSDFDGQSSQGGFSVSTPVIGTSEYEHAKFLAHFEEQNELGQYLLGPALKRAGGTSETTVLVAEIRITRLGICIMISSRPRRNHMPKPPSNSPPISPSNSGSQPHSMMTSK